MVGALDMAAHEGVNLGIALHALARLDLPPTPTREGRLREDLAGKPDRGAELDQIVRVGEVVELDARRLGFRIFTTAIPIRAAKWVTEEES